MTITWPNRRYPPHGETIDVDFPQFAQHGVSLKYRTTSAMLSVYDAKNPNSTIGRTRADRYPVHLDRLFDVATHIHQQTNQPISVLFGGCSLGLEPRSFTRRVLEKQASDKITISALDKNPNYLACMNERLLPYEAIALMQFREDWHPFLREVEAGKVYALSEELEDMIQVHEAQSLLDHKQIYDVVNIFHIVQHLPSEQQLALMAHLCTTTRHAIAIDHESATEFGKDREADDNHDTCQQRLHQHMNNAGFKALKARPHNKKHRYSMAGSKPDKSLIFCREDIITELENALEPS